MSLRFNENPSPFIGLVKILTRDFFSNFLIFELLGDCIGKPINVNVVVKVTADS